MDRIESLDDMDQQDAAIQPFPAQAIPVAFPRNARLYTDNQDMVLKTIQQGTRILCKVTRFKNTLKTRFLCFVEESTGNRYCLTADKKAGKDPKYIISTMVEYPNGQEIYLGCVK